MKVQRIDKNIKKIKGKRVFLRVDFNVPVANGRIKEETKIIASLPTIRFLLRYGAKVIIATHFGRPEGKINKKYSTKLIAKRLAKILGANKVKFADMSDKKELVKQSLSLESGKILFLQNLRFFKKEKTNNSGFAKSLASLADVYVNEAFSVSHRKHASVCAIKKYLPSFIGFLVASEIKNLNRIKKPKRPLIILLGGSKINTKIKLINNLEAKSFKILIGGALANNFLKANKLEIGKSLIDKKTIKIAKKLKSKKIILPIDVVIKSGTKVKIKKVDEVLKTEKILDIGPETVKLFTSYIKKANTLVWNGPLGMFEDSKFRHGTLDLAKKIANKSSGLAFGVAGGGETIEALRMAKVENKLDWVSTGGGAMLAYLGGQDMPGLF